MVQLLLWALCVSATAKSSGVPAASTLVLVFHVKLIINFNRCIDLIFDSCKNYNNFKKMVSTYIKLAAKKLKNIS